MIEAGEAELYRYLSIYFMYILPGRSRREGWTRSNVDMPDECVSFLWQTAALSCAAGAFFREFFLERDRLAEGIPANSMVPRKGVLEACPWGEAF